MFMLLSTVISAWSSAHERVRNIVSTVTAITITAADANFMVENIPAALLHIVMFLLSVFLFAIFTTLLGYDKR